MLLSLLTQLRRGVACAAPRPLSQQRGICCPATYGALESQRREVFSSLAAEGLDIAEQLGTGPDTVSKWRRRFVQQRLAGLIDPRTRTTGPIRTRTHLERSTTPCARPSRPRIGRARTLRNQPHPFSASGMPTNSNPICVPSSAQTHSARRHRALSQPPRTAMASDTAPSPGYR